MGFDHYGVSRKAAGKGGSNPPPSAGYPQDGAINVEGQGPLKGWLRPKPGAGVSFPDGGLMWCDVVDVWGNPFLLLVGEGKSSLYDVDPDHVGGISWVGSMGGRNKLQQQTRALAAYQDADAKIMTAMGWIVDDSRPDLMWGWSEGGGDPFLSEAANYGGALSVGMVNATGKKWRQSSPLENAGIVAGDLIAPTPAAADQFIHDPYIDNVVIQIPVDPANAKDFPGYVIARVNRYTRTAVITGLCWHGFGSSDAYDAYRNNPDQLLLAIGKTLIGLVLIVVGVIVAIYGGGSGVALIVAGISLIVSAWYDFSASHALHGQAINSALGDGKGNKLLARALPQLQQHKDSGNGSQKPTGLLAVVGGLAAAIFGG